MSSAYQPEVASGNTSSAVRLPKPITLSGGTLNGSKPLSSGVQHTGAPHVSTAGMHQPTHNFTSGSPKMSATHETRNSTNGVPHTNMHPSSGGF
jgi:hypothetical protein